MSNDERPEFQALDQMEEVLRQVTEELASFRRRALRAEAERTVTGVDDDSPVSRDRLAKLETENAELRRRFEAVRTRLNGLLNRLHFLEEQTAVEGQRQI